MVIVGDTKQLPNVVTADDKAKAKAIFESFNIHEGYQFTKSFLQSVLEIMPNVTQTLLREHYRCHPKIINFCNQKFYRGELIIMTEDKGEEDALEKEFKDIDAATVHKFQGKEKDTIIISTVDDEISDFADDPYLINVAVSRAKKKLLLVVTGNEQIKGRNITDLMAYIQYQNFDVTDSRIYSIFDYLYKQYREERMAYLQKHKRISEYDSENLMYSLIEDVLSVDRYACFDVVCHFPMNMLIKNPETLNKQERQYIMNPAAHIDFLIYNRMSKNPALAIEVDGYGYHKAGTVQALRDLLKNHILELYEIPLLRFKTNGSEEKEQIVKRLDEIVGSS